MPENTTWAVKPRKLGTLARTAYPGILELCHSIGVKIGVLPKTAKSNALCVYLQRNSPSTTKYFPNACCRPAWNSFRYPGEIAAGTHGTSAAITGELQPKLETT